MKLYHVDIELNRVKQRFNEYKYQSVEIVHRPFEFAQANIGMSQVARVLIGSYFALIEGDSVLFIGQLTQIENAKLVLISIPRDFNNQKDAWNKQHVGNYLYKSTKRRPITYTCNDWSTRTVMRCTDKVYLLDPANIIQCNTRHYTPKWYKYFKVHVKWGKFISQTIDLGKQIFSKGPIRTFTPNSLINSWPSANSVYSQCNVVYSKLEVTKKSWINIGDKYMQRSELNGDLILERKLRYDFDEIWKMELSNISCNTEDVLELYLDLSEFIANAMVWQADRAYAKDDRVLLEQNGIYRLARCIENHISSGEVTSKYWDLADDLEYLIANGSFLVENMVGKLLLTEILTYILSERVLNEPDLSVDFTGPWDIWKDLQLHDRVQFVLDDKTIIGQVAEYIKIYSNKTKIVKVKCNFMALKDLDEVEPYEKLTDAIDISKKLSSSYSDFIVDNNVTIENAAEDQRSDLKPTCIKFALQPSVVKVTNKIELSCNIRGIV